MKQILFLIFVLFVAGGCLDDKNNYDYRDINNYDDTWKISGIARRYTFFPGESVTLTPKVRLSMDTLNPDVAYSWLIDGVEVATTATYTYEAKETGSYILLLSVKDKKTGVSFLVDSEIDVTSLYKLGWLFLSRTASNNSRLSMLVAKNNKVYYTTSSGYTRYRDSLVFVEFHTNIGGSLGSGPIRLVEEFPFLGETAVEPSEVMIVQESGPTELSGTELTFTGHALDEFMDGAANIKVKNVALGWSSKWLQADDNRLYVAVPNVLTDLHSGRYNNDPAFAGAKYHTLIDVMKAGESYERPNVFLGIDETNTMWAFIDEADAKYGVPGDIIDPQNSVGARARLKNNFEGTIDMSLFNGFTGRYIKHVLVNSDDYFLSLLEKDGKYMWHKYLITVDRNYVVGNEIAVSSSATGLFASEVFTDFKDATFVKGRDKNYDNMEWLFVASGNKLYGTVMDWGKTGDNKQTSKNFYTSSSSEIVSVKARFFKNSFDNYIHLGVLLADGTFLVLEVYYDSLLKEFKTKTIYEMNLKVLDPEINEIVDVIHKYGECWNVTEGSVN